MANIQGATKKKANRKNTKKRRIEYTEETSVKVPLFFTLKKRNFRKFAKKSHHIKGAFFGLFYTLPILEWKIL